MYIKIKSEHRIMSENKKFYKAFWSFYLLIAQKNNKYIKTNLRRISNFI